MIPQLVTFAQAKAHLRSDGTYDDTDIDFKLSQASEIVMDYLKISELPDTWYADESPTASPLVYAIPFTVQAATLLVLGELFENRESTTGNVISEHVVNLLMRLRDPALS